MLMPKDTFSFNTYFVDRNRLEKQVLERSGFDSCGERINSRGNTGEGIEVIQNLELFTKRNNMCLQESELFIKLL